VLHRKLSAAIALAACALLAHAETATSPLLKEVGARLAAESSVDQQFVQEKRLRILKRPLRTEGTMLYRRERGVCWHTAQPVESTLVLGEQQLLQINGDQTLRLKAEQQPALFGFTRLFFAALSGQVDKLAEHFELQAGGTADHWQLDLQPRDALLQKFIARMMLRGGVRVEQVEVVDREGEITHIQFSPLSAPAGALEQRCFAE
jgi:outer membrane lipoprotein-sorting protein